MTDYANYTISGDDMMEVMVMHSGADVWPAPDEPFLQPDYIAAPVNGAPGEPIALMRREGGA